VRPCSCALRAGERAAFPAPSTSTRCPAGPAAPPCRRRPQTSRTASAVAPADPRASRPEPGGEEHRAPAHVQALGVACTARISSSTSGVKVRHQGGDAVALLQPRPARDARVPPRRPYRQHPARTGRRVLHLPPGGDDLADARSDPGRVAPALPRELPEGGRVDVQALDVDGELVGPQRHPWIEDLRLLREHAGRAHTAPQPVRVLTHACPRWASAGAGASRRPRSASA
jgi:hypothetical protein